MRRLILSLIVASCSICLLTTSVYAKGKPDNPGKSGNAPGQSGESPGNSGSAPGQVKKEVSEVTIDALVTLSSQVKTITDVKNSRADYLEDFLYSRAILGLTSYERASLLNSNKYEKIKTQMEITILAYRLDLITKVEARNRVVRHLDRLEELLSSGKFLGFLFRCNGIFCK